MICIVLLGIVLALFVLFIYKSIYIPTRIWKELNVPYLTPWPIVGQMGDFIFGRKPLSDWMSDLYNTYNDENIRYFGFFNFVKPVLLIKDIDLIKQITMKDFDHFVDHSQFVTEEIDPLFGKNLFSLRGYRWKQMRSTLSPAFTGKKMRTMFALISDCADQFINHFAKLTNPNEPLEIEMKDVFSRFSNDVIASTAFGIKCDSLVEKDNEFYTIAKDAVRFSGLRAFKFLGCSISMKLMNLLGVEMFGKEVGNFFRRLIVENVKTREENGIMRPDMIHLLMEARKGRLKHEDILSSVEDSAGYATAEESEIGKDAKMAKLDLTDDDMTAQALIFIAGGLDAISTALCNVAYGLALHVDVQEKLQKEIDKTWIECNGTITYEVIMKMKYMDMVVSESLRKWTAAVFVDRVCTETYTIKPTNPNEKEITLNKDDVVWIPIHGIHKDPKYFPDPEKFDPERFSDENKGNILPYTYSPFGMGPRNCIGSRFALLEAKIILFHLFHKFSLEVTEKTQIPLRLRKLNINVMAENGYWLGLRLRNNK